MSTTLWAILLLITAAIAGSLIWRFSSRRSSIPCPAWLGWLVEMENPIAREYNAASIISHLDLRPGMAVLDAGCGPGRVTVALARTVGQHGTVTAVDLQPRMLEQARQRLHEAGRSNVEFRELGLGTGQLESDRYDRATLVTVLGEIPDRAAALADLYRSLKPGGVLSVTETIFDPHYQSRSSVVKLGGTVGFQEAGHWGNLFSFTLHLVKPSNGSI